MSKTNNRIWLFLFISLFFSLTVRAQHASICGNVTDSKTGESLVGALVAVEGEATGAVTNLEGSCRIEKCLQGNIYLQSPIYPTRHNVYKISK